MPFSQIAGYVGLILGVVCLYFVWRASNTPMDQLANAATGRFTQSTMLYLMGGVGLVIAGSLSLLFGPRNA